MRARLLLATPALLLPNLVQEPPSRIDATAVTTAQGVRWHLGFRSAVHNAGAGPLIVAARRSTRARGEMAALQIVQRAAGRPVRRRPFGAVRFVRSVDHRHWHLIGFETYELRGIDAPSIRRDSKSGFCLGDRYSVQPALAPAYVGQCGLDRPDLLRIRQGISVGFGDEYHPHLEGQHVDVTGLPAGRYDVVHRVNVARSLLEESYADNAACTGIELGWREGAAEVREGPCYAPASSIASTRASTS